MKKYILFVSSILVATILGTGCTSFTTNRIGAPLETEMKLHIKPNVTISQKKVSAEATSKALFKIFTWGVSKTAEGVTFNGGSMFTSLDPATNQAKAGAVYNACTKAKSDLLISPQYDISVLDYFLYKEVKCKVSGFPAKLNSVEVMPKPSQHT